MKDINTYIRYEEMWRDIVNDWINNLELIDNPSIEQFIKNNNMPLLVSECSFDGNIVTFCFSEVTSPGNESDPQEGWFSVIISYDIHSECFDHYEEDMG